MSQEIIEKLNILAKEFDKKCEILKLKIDETLYDLGYKSVDTIYSYLLLEIEQYQSMLSEEDIDGHIFCGKMKEFLDESFNKLKNE